MDFLIQMTILIINKKISILCMINFLKNLIISLIIKKTFMKNHIIIYNIKHLKDQKEI